MIKTRKNKLRKEKKIQILESGRNANKHRKAQYGGSFVQNKALF